MWLRFEVLMLNFLGLCSGVQGFNPGDTIATKNPVRPYYTEGHNSQGLRHLGSCGTIAQFGFMFMFHVSFQFDSPVVGSL